MTVLLYVIGAIAAMIILARLNAWAKHTWVFRPRPFIQAEPRRPRKACPFPITDTWGRWAWSVGHRPGPDCPKCSGS
jgi:hypothetical protein